MAARRGCALALLTLLQQPPLGAPQQQAAELCHIADLFAHLTAITTDEECLAGRDGGRGPPPSSEGGAPWYPSSMDDCNAMCGVVFEPFWDQCGDMLTNAQMGGMEEMGVFCASPAPTCTVGEPAAG